MRLAILTSVLLVEMCVDGEAPLPPLAARNPLRSPHSHTPALSCARTRRQVFEDPENRGFLGKLLSSAGNS